MNLERELRNALRREPPPEGFAARVLAETRAMHIRTTPWWKRPATLALAAALILSLLIPLSDYRRREQERGLAAKQQLMNALAITRVQLQQAKARVRRNTRHAL